MDKIVGFNGEYEFLSNSYNCKIYDEKDKLTYSNIESALIAQKSTDFGTRRKFTRLNAMKARKKESSIPDNYEWEDNKDKIMYSFIVDKFKKGSSLADKLIKTGNKILINAVSYPDEYYGVHYGKGENKLGKMLMKRREELLAE